MTETYIRTVIACRALQPELDALLDETGETGIRVRYLDQSLHRTPQIMPGIIQSAIEEEKAAADQLVLGYGLCANGVTGVRAPAQGLIIPRVHDCIALFLGSREAYQRAFKEKPGSYYLTPGWIAEKKDPLGFLEDDYIPRVGEADAVWAAREELKHYTHIVLIYSAATKNLPELRERARENTRFFEKQLEERRGSDGYFRSILFGPYNEDDFVYIPAGEMVTQRPFLDM